MRSLSLSGPAYFSGSDATKTPGPGSPGLYPNEPIANTEPDPSGGTRVESSTSLLSAGSNLVTSTQEQCVNSGLPVSQSAVVGNGSRWCAASHSKISEGLAVAGSRHSRLKPLDCSFLPRGSSSLFANSQRTGRLVVLTANKRLLSIAARGLPPAATAAAQTSGMRAAT